MLELVRYQEKEMPKVSGDEYQVISAEEMLRAEKRTKPDCAHMGHLCCNKIGIVIN